MTAPLPSLDVAQPGTHCPKCGAEMGLVDWCANCFEVFLQEREALAQRDLETARARTRAWRHAKAVQS